MKRRFMNTAIKGAVFAKKADKGERAEIAIYGVIENEKWFDSDVTPLEVKRALAEVADADAVDIFINSPGGDAFAGIAIHNIIKRHKALTVAHVDGWAASAASIILQGADERIMYPGSMVMIHNAWTIALGDKNSMMKTADDLEVLDGSLKDVYASRAKVSAEELTAMMDAETWMNADDAVKMGFADRISDGKKVDAKAGDDGKVTVNGMEYDTSIYNRFPGAKPEPEPQAAAPTPEPEPPVDDTENKNAAIKAEQEVYEMRMYENSLKLMEVDV